jgi:hypothetical protein
MLFIFFHFTSYLTHTTIHFFSSHFMSLLYVLRVCLYLLWFSSVFLHYYPLWTYFPPKAPINLYFFLSLSNASAKRAICFASSFHLPSSTSYNYSLLLVLSVLFKIALFSFKSLPTFYFSLPSFYLLFRSHCIPRRQVAHLTYPPESSSEEMFHHFTSASWQPQQRELVILEPVSQMNHTYDKPFLIFIAAALFF